MSTATEPALLRLKRGEDKRLRAGHLWIFSNEVDTAATPLTAFQPGQQVRVVTDRGQVLGIAYVNPATLICARIVVRHSGDHGDAHIDRRLITARLRSALALRERLYPSPHYRWCFGESDLLPGLVLDRFGDVVVGQITTAGMEALREEVEAAIRAVLAPAALVWKNDSGARALEGLPPAVTIAWGTPPDDVEILEHPSPGRSLRFVAPLAEGQKTGWFYDQAWNRARLPRYLAPGARVLDVCSYAGGWGITAATHGAASVACVDSSQRALDAVARNAAVNGVAIEPLRGDAFEVLESLATAGRRFDAVVVDPPAFIKRRKEIPAGQAAYRKLNQLALRVLAPEGLLVSCSCSHHLEPDALVGAIQTAARHVDRFVQILESGGQAPDHPVHPAIPETRYLKAFFCRVTHD
jgi:23S rRNA (cytosine1962-C5)-methyltransferase